jgi:hypothetical protein
MDNRLDEYSNMLFESAKEVFKVIKNPKMSEENKVLLASVNALTNATKTAIQNEILRYKVDNTNGTLLKLIEKIDD